MVCGLEVILEGQLSPTMSPPMCSSQLLTPLPFSHCRWHSRRLFNSQPSPRSHSQRPEIPSQKTTLPSGGGGGQEPSLNRRHRRRGRLPPSRRRIARQPAETGEEVRDRWSRDSAERGARGEARRGAAGRRHRGWEFGDAPWGGQECAGAEGASGSLRSSGTGGPRGGQPTGTATAEPGSESAAERQPATRRRCPTADMAEPLLRKTFAKLRARRRKSLKGGRSEDSEIPETAAVATNGDGVQAAKCAIGEARSDRISGVGSCRSPGVPVPSCGADGGTDSTNRATCTSGLAQSSGPEQDIHPARKTRNTAEEGEIWYNPIPEDEDIVPVARRPGTSKAQWYVEVPCPKEAETAGGARKPSCVGTSGGTETMLEPRAVRCPAESSPPKHRAPSVTATGVSWSCSQQGSSAQKPRHSDGAADAQMESSQGPAPSPRPAKKSAAAHRSLSDRVKSPGTVRKLSMRMRKLPELRRKLSLRGTSRSGRQEREGGGESGRACAPPAPPSSGPALPASDRNVICRYHLDTSVSARGNCPRPKKQRGPRSLTKLGYLSDGDSPELVAKAEKPSTRWHPGLDTGSFRPYGGGEHPRCLQYLSGLINIRLFGIEGVRLPRPGLRDIFCTIQVDSVSKARTALLTCQDPFLSLDHTFNIELEHSQQLKLLVFTWDPSSCRNRICCHGTALLPPLFKGARTHQLAMQLEPRGVLYLKVSLVEVWEVPACCADEHREPRVFKVELSELVGREHSGVNVPLLIQKCVSEIEKRGLKAVGLYRLCGSAAVKKELRDSFERDSASVDLSEEIYPDINVITGILKDYLRELPSPLITKTLYDVVLETTATWPLKMSNGVPDASLCSVNTVALLNCLPQAEKATLTLLLDHLSLVASLQESNKMTCQNLAVCFGPVLLGQKQETSQQGSCTFSHSKELANALDFKRHIEVLHYLLQLWPSDRIKEKRDMSMEQPNLANRLRPRPQIPAVSPAAEEVVCRNRVGRSASSSRYRHAGDWSSCGRNYLRPGNDQKVDDRGQFTKLGTNVLGSPASTDTQDSSSRLTDTKDGGSRQTDTQDGGSRLMDKQDGGSNPTSGRNYDLYPVNGQGDSLFPDNSQGSSLFSDGGELDFESSLGGRTKEFDSLIADIERELAKKIIFL
ncbi:rho GTPase-activating protein SYDE1-like [Pristis pectinata]|uniref:rho GTPase-activating protein SYDE1-like n=1 Tax=Pristis pectinata TaxID=685728 RepID=UPI00223C9437|nr:rho GTPase-activating protein SYDE1-like [Pristis pectinata]